MFSAKQAETSSVRLKVIVADNTPGGQTASDLSTAVVYRAYKDNPGLAEPYNDALAVAAEEGFDWLLTLDQDTRLPAEFITTMASTARAYTGTLEVAAVVPRIVDVNRLISPFRYVRGVWPVVLPAQIIGIAPPHTSALNSASLLRVRALLDLNGYDLSFPLHNSDTRLYQKLDQASKYVVVANVTVLHELSILRREKRMNPDRYRLMLQDECRFWDRHMGWLSRTERTIRLLGRYVKGILQKEAPAFQSITAMEIRYRLLTRRRIRLRASAATPAQNSKEAVLPVLSRE